MKRSGIFIVLVQIFMVSCARANQEGSLPPSVLRNIQISDCYPNTPEAKSWPVQAIYLHGLFSPNSSTDYYGNLETDNRDYLEALANRLRLRIAVPLSDSLSPQGYRYWNGMALSRIEDMASKACNAPLADARALIGFSNGGYAARHISYLNCAAISAYTKLLAIGFPEDDGGNCGNYVHVAPHVFPPAEKDFFDVELASLKEKSDISGEVSAAHRPPWEWNKLLSSK